MAQIYDYPSCCSAKAAIKFGQNFDSREVQSVTSIKADLTNQMNEIKKQNHFTVVTAIIIRMQKNAKKALEELGFKQASGWMLKPTVEFDVEAYVTTRMAAFGRDADMYKQRVLENRMTQHDCDYYSKNLTEERARKEANQAKVNTEETNAHNEARATMLFYLPLVGEEE